MYTDQFGYVPQSERVTWSGGAFEPLPDFANTVSYVESETNADDYLYPPIQHTRRLYLDGSTRRVSRTTRPALLHKLPATHALLLQQSADQRTMRTGLAGFLVHFYGFLYGYRCQFHDWWVDGRIPMKKQNDRACVRAADAAMCFERACNTWLNWPRHKQTVATNALFLQLRAIGYEWPWERFQAEYQVLDAAFSLVRESFGKKPIPHGKRIESLCRQYGLALDEDRVSMIVKARNDLIHETLWGGANPLESRGDYLLPIWLNRLTARLLLAILGIQGDYIKTPWWSLGQFFFDVR